MTTLRRELRTRFYQVLGNYLQDFLMSEEEASKMVDDLADAALSVRGIALSGNLSIDNAIAAGLPVTEEMAEEASIKNNAPRLFEKALGFSKPLPWGVGKEWTEFSDWVCDRYRESKTSFGEYNIWRNTQYTKGGMSNNRIRGFVKEFYDSWDMFMMSKQPKTDETRPEYKPIPQDDIQAVPNPLPKPRLS